MNQFKSEEKLSITGLLRVVYKSKRIILFFIMAFVLLGVFVYLFSPKEYSTSAVLMPESSGSNSGISGLASLAGINVGGLDNKERTLPTVVYEPIIRSNSFLNKIINFEYEFPSIGQDLILKDYFHDYCEPSFSDKLVDLFTFRWLKSSGTSLPQSAQVDSLINTNPKIFSNSIIKVSSKKAIKDLNDRLYYSKDITTGLITMSIDFQDANAGAKVLQKIIAELMSITKEYQGQKDSINLAQVEIQLVEKRREYEKALELHANFLDGNINLIRSVDKLTEQKLQNEIQFAFGVYNSLLQQREQISIQSKSIQDPISVIEPIQIATGPSSPRILRIMIICIFMGSFFGVLYVLVKESLLVIIQ